MPRTAESREAMGEASKDALRVGFDKSTKLEFHGSKVTSDAGLLPYRERDDVLRLTTMAESLLHDWRTGRNRRHTVVGLLRQPVFSRLAGYEDSNEADRTSADPRIRHVMGGRAEAKRAAFGPGALPASAIAAIVERWQSVMAVSVRRSATQRQSVLASRLITGGWRPGPELLEAQDPGRGRAGFDLRNGVVKKCHFVALFLFAFRFDEVTAHRF